MDFSDKNFLCVPRQTATIIKESREVDSNCACSWTIFQAINPYYQAFCHTLNDNVDFSDKNFLCVPRQTATIIKESREVDSNCACSWTIFQAINPYYQAFCHTLTPEIQSVRFGGGSLGLPFPKSRFISKSWKNKQTASTAFLQELFSLASISYR